MFKLRGIFEVDFLNNVFLFKFRSTFGVYFISKKSRSIIEVLLKYKQSTFLFFCFYTSFILFFEEVHLKHTSIGLQEESEV